MFSYSQIRKWITTACQSIKNDFLSLPSTQKDGRINSSMNETWYLKKITSYLHQYEPQLNVHCSMSREWYDISVDGIPINLKLTMGGTDNAFNKTSIDYTISGKIPERKKISYNEWMSRLRNEFGHMTNVRDFHGEYHFLAIDKIDGKHCFKSMIDIQSYRSNPSNILQICWKSEFDGDDKKSIRHLKLVDKREKLLDILSLVQQSLRQDYDSKRDFIDFSLPSYMLHQGENDTNDTNDTNDKKSKKRKVNNTL